MFALSNRLLDNDAIDESAEYYTEELIEIIPLESLMPSWNRAKRNSKSSFAPNAFDMIRAFGELEADQKAANERKRAEAVAGNPILLCGHYELHTGDKARGEIYGDPFQNGKDEKFPCPSCRREDNEDWKKLQISLYGEHQHKTVITPDVDPQFRKSIFVSPIEEIIDPKVGEQLAVEYNDLLYRKTTDADTRKLYFAVFDEGGNCFKYASRPAHTFSLKSFRKTIEQYRESAAK